MSEKNKAGLNEVDMQAVIAAWIIANDGCGSSNDVHCCGDMGIFKGTACLFYGHTGCIADVKVGEAKAWLEKYHQQKAEAAEAEKRKAEVAKKEGQETKRETARICGNCKHIHEVEKSGNMIAHCDMKKNMVPISFDRCPDFEPRAAADQFGSPPSEGGVDAAAYAEHITQLKKENARLAEEVNGYRGVTRRISEICEAIATDIDQVAKEREELRNQLILAQGDALRLGKENSNLQARCELLAEQLKRLAEYQKHLERTVERQQADLATSYVLLLNG